MSDFLGNCLRTAIIVAFGMAVLNFVFMIVTLAYPEPDPDRARSVPVLAPLVIPAQAGIPLLVCR